MKTIFTALIFIFILSSFTSYAQKKNFIRVYNFEGKKIYAGHITEADANFLHLKRGKMTYTVPYNTIGHIKAYRSFGHDAGGGAAYGGLVGLGAGAVLFFSIASNDTSGIGGAMAAGYAAVTPLITALAGYIIGMNVFGLKKKVSYEIDGKQAQWDIFRNAYYNHHPPSQDSARHAINKNLLSTEE